MAACIEYKFYTPAVRAIITPVAVESQITGEVLTLEEAKCRTKVAAETRPRMATPDVQRDVDFQVKWQPRVLNVSVYPYQPEEKPAKISVTVTKMYADNWRPRYTFETITSRVPIYVSEQTVSLFCPIDLIKSCFGSGKWIEYRPWLMKEAWKYSKKKK
jgi:hypothetical protein